MREFAMRWCRLSHGRLDLFATDWRVTPGSTISWLRPLALSLRNLKHATAWRRYSRRPVRIETRHIAEFGTMSGSTAAVLAQAMQCPFEGQTLPGDQRFAPKNLYLFDSFEGLPPAESEIDQDCPHVRDGVWGAGTCRQLSEEDLRWVCQQYLPAQGVLTMKGWFRNSLLRLEPGVQFALIHIDSDLYQSAIDVLDHCFAPRRVPPGGMIFFDDWNSNHASPDFGERRAWAEIVPKYQVHYSDAGSYGYSCQKFIVHEYRS